MLLFRSEKMNVRMVKNLTIFLSSTFDDKMLEKRELFRNELVSKLNRIYGQIVGNC